MSKAKTWPKIGTVRKSDKGTYIKLESNVSILVDGKPVEMNESRTIRLDDPRKKTEFLFQNGYINEADYNKRLETLSENTWLRYELVVPPAKTNQ